ncbi:MAG: DUF559 domain-containing protein [Ignavibacteriae bacterium]|nr:DUF559 domain-containing protein [Ignavibacteriota bacterium]NOG99725.1 DUF559 domain-containing protein [Ignavibacteriota bacterium]
MSKHLNKPELKQRRRQLRQDQTYAEKVMWSQLRNRQFLGIKFKRQYSVDNYVLDYYAPELKLAIELDGSVHNEPEQFEYEKIRQKHIEKFGIKFIRVTNKELLSNPNKTFSKIENEINKLDNN